MSENLLSPCASEAHISRFLFADDPDGVLAGESLDSSSVITDEIKELRQATPFKPIRIVLGDQQSFTVAHPDFLMISPDRQTIVLYDEHNRFKIINAQQIRLVEPAGHSAASGA